MNETETLTLVIRLLGLIGLLLGGLLAWVILTERRLSKVEAKLSLIAMNSFKCPFVKPNNPCPANPAKTKKG